MKYKIRLSAPRGDIVPLFVVASTKAQVVATAGGTPFHRPTYRGSLKGFVSDILSEARSGRLNVCNVWGSPRSAEELIAEAERTGSLVSTARFAKDPDWGRILKKKKPIAPGLWDLSAVDLGPTVLDLDATHISAMYATLKSLNDWGSYRGDEFSVTHDGAEWLDERGVMGRTAPHVPLTGLLQGAAEDKREPSTEDPVPPLLVADDAARPARTDAKSDSTSLFALARSEALSAIKRWAARGLYPSQSVIADEVAADLRKRGIFGTDGKPLTGATIKRHALRGISTGRKKAQSTTLKRGK